MSTLTTTQWGPIGETVYRRTYSRPMSDGTQEEWPDTCRRVAWGNADTEEEAEEVYLRMLQMEMLPAGRHLWITGTGMPHSRNCWRAPFTNRMADHFSFMGGQLLVGGGVGANYSQEYLRRAPQIDSAGVDLYLTIGPEHPDYEAVRSVVPNSMWSGGLLRSHLIDDSREGWIDSWERLFDAATVTGGTRSLTLDLSLVRAAGAPIRTFGGTASGPAPLAQSLVGIATVLNGARGRYLTALEAMECDHQIASAVVAGGARRSARMSILHWRDPSIMEFIKCKADHQHHWTTNISVEVDKAFFDSFSRGDDHARTVYWAVIHGMHANGEPGFYNQALGSFGETGDVRSTNPCGEINLEESESCNIGSVNLAQYGPDDDDAADQSFRLMARFLLRASLKGANEVEEKNRRIGVGFLGLQEWALRHGVRYSEIPFSEVLTEKIVRFRKAVRQEADAYARELGIARPIKVTAIAPNGTISQLPGTQAGAHAIPFAYFIRNVRYTLGDPQLAELAASGRTIEPCIYADNTMVVSFPTRDSLVDRYGSLVESAADLSVQQQLEVLAWVTQHFTGGDDGNAVSFTVNYDPTEYGDGGHHLGRLIERYLPVLKGVTVFPATSRPQAPLIPLTAWQYEVEAARVRGEIEASDSNDGVCVGAVCPVR